MPSHEDAAVGWDAFHLAEVLLTQPMCIVVVTNWAQWIKYRRPIDIL